MNTLPDYIKGERVQLCRSLPSHASAVWQFVKDNQDFFMKWQNSCRTSEKEIFDYFTELNSDKDSKDFYYTIFLDDRINRYCKWLGCQYMANNRSGQTFDNRTYIFSDKAKNSAKNAHGHSIVLIDGPMLAKLMREHNLGAKQKKNYDIKEFDAAYFE